MGHSHRGRDQRDQGRGTFRVSEWGFFPDTRGATGAQAGDCGSKPPRSSPGPETRPAEC